MLGVYNQAEMAMASYADLSDGLTGNYLQNLVVEKFSPTQVQEFSARYPEIVTQFNDTDTSFSATVFKDTDGNLTLAIRGTSEILGDIVPTDADIAYKGAGYDQIIAMYNWWISASSTTGQTVNQFDMQSYREGIDPVPPGAVFLYRQEGTGPVPIATETYLIPTASVVATGELVSSLLVDADNQLDVTCHSLGELQLLRLLEIKQIGMAA